MRILIISLLIFFLAPFSANCQSLISKADSLYFKGDWEKAIPLYKTYLSDTSTNPVIWQRLAFSNQQAGKYKEAIRYFQKAFSLNPSAQLKFSMYSNILTVYDKLDQGHEALEFIKPIVENGYGNFVLLESFPMFNSFKNSAEYKEVIEKAKMNAYPCLSDPHRKQMDFWVGEWDVYPNGSNSIVGKSSITKEDGGCVIIEHFESLLAPQTGHSINIYDPADSSWKQLYAGTGGRYQLYTNGIYKDSAMVFDYELTANGKTGKGHYILYNLGPDQFRQYQDISFDGGKTVTVYYDYIYRRKKATK